MQHVSIYNSMDTPSHMPAHTRPLMHTPQYNTTHYHGDMVICSVLILAPGNWVNPSRHLHIKIGIVGTDS